MSKFTYKKEERLKSRKIIEQLFKNGHSFSVYPLRLVWLELHEKQGNYPIKFSVSVPKRSFPKAVNRSRIKRLIRETWRLNKFWLYEKVNPEKQFAFMLIYTGKEALDVKVLENSLRRINRKFLKKSQISSSKSESS